MTDLKSNDGALLKPGMEAMLEKYQAPIAQAEELMDGLERSRVKLEREREAEKSISKKRGGQPGKRGPYNKKGRKNVKEKVKAKAQESDTPEA